MKLKDNEKTEIMKLKPQKTKKLKKQKTINCRKRKKKEKKVGVQDFGRHSNLKG